MPAELFQSLVKAALAERGTQDAERRTIHLGNVEFWMDAAGPWAGQLSFDLPTDQWNTRAIAEDICRA